MLKKASMVIHPSSKQRRRSLNVGTALFSVINSPLITLRRVTWPRRRRRQVGSVVVDLSAFLFRA